MSTVTVQKADEARLFNMMRGGYCEHGAPAVRPLDAAAEIGMNEKRAMAILEKWTGRGWWDYGVSAQCGWFEPGAPGKLEARA